MSQFNPQSVPEQKTKKSKVVVPIPLAGSSNDILPAPRDRANERRRPSKANSSKTKQGQHSRPMHSSSSSSSSDSEDGGRGENSIFSPNPATERHSSDVSQPSSPLTGRRPSGAPAQGLDVDDCLEYMVKFVEKSDLTRIIWRHDIEYNPVEHRNELRERLRPQAKIAAGLPSRIKFVNREFMNNFAILSLYDLAVLVDDSQSMSFEEKGDRIKAMKKVLAYLAHVFGLSSKDRGISAIRFLNGSDDLKANNLKEDQIDSVIDRHEFEGLTKIGTGLMSKILKPLVFAEGEVWNKQDKKPRRLRQLKRPLLIMVITDGAVEGEPHVRLPQAIKSVHDSLQAAGYAEDTKAVVFQFARVGNDENAQKYLKFLDDHSKVKDLVDTMSGNDLMDVIGWRSTDSEEEELNESQQRKMIKLLLGPISAQFDKEVEKELDCDDEFDDEEPDYDWQKFSEGAFE